MKSYIAREFGAALDTFREMAADEGLADQIVRAVQLCTEALRAGNLLMFAGNGGSAADAQHWAGELASRFYYDRPALRAVALTTDTSVLTAVGNDYGYDYVFARQVEALGKPGDVLFAISTSGRSPNILRAVNAAIARDIRVVGFTGSEGEEFAGMCDVCFRIPQRQTPRIQEGHEFLGHLICGLIEAQMFPSDAD